MPRDGGAVDAFPRLAPLRETDSVPLRPPYNPEAEQALLGAILVNNSAWHRVAPFLGPEHFGNAVHGRIYKAVSELIAAGRPATPVILAPMFAHDEALARFGAGGYLARLAGAAVTIINAEHYGRQILDLAIRRELIVLGEELAAEAAKPDSLDGADLLLARTASRLESLTPQRPGTWRKGDRDVAQPLPREWLIDGMAMPGTTLLLSGDGEIGKSLLTLQLCCCAAAGEPWLGVPVASGGALFLACEDDEAEMTARLWRICHATGIGPWTLGALAYLCRPGEHSFLIEFDRWTGEPRSTPLFRELWAAVRRAKPRYIVIDTATATFGGDQNNDRQVMAYLTLLRRLAMLSGAVVVINKHPSVAGRKTSGESGSVAWHNGVRSRLWLRRDAAGMLALEHVKSNYGRRCEPIPLEWRDGALMRAVPRSYGDAG